MKYAFCVCGVHQASHLYAHMLLPLSLPPISPPISPPLVPSPQTSEIGTLQAQLKSLAHEHEKEIRKKDSEVLTVYSSCTHMNTCRQCTSK